jgi:hypothetical protein
MARRGGVRLEGGAGRRDMCDTLRADGVDGPTCNSVLAAADEGHAELAAWLLSLAPSMLPDLAPALLRSAARGCDLGGLQLMADLAGRGGLVDDRDSLLERALLGSNPDWRAKVDWLVEQGGALEPSPWYMPGPSGPHEVAQRAERYLDLLPATARAAGAKTVLSWAICLASPDLVELVVVRLAGQMVRLVPPEEAKTYLDIDFDDLTAGSAAIAAQLAVRGRLPIWPTVVEMASRTGDLRLLQWMWAGVSARAAEEAGLEAGQQADLEFLSEAGPEVRADAAAALVAALRNPDAGLIGAAAACGSLELVQWLRARGCVWNDWNFMYAAEAGSVALLEWMVAQGCPMMVSVPGRCGRVTPSGVAHFAPALTKRSGPADPA